MPTTLTVQGNYGQITAFVNGLDNFPRLFVIQKFTLAFGAAAAGSTQASTGGSPASGASTSASGSASGPPLWVGGQQTPGTSGPYNLQITGSIYYTSTPNALSACSKAKAAEPTVK